jgi:hypothetical protein
MRARGEELWCRAGWPLWYSFAFCSVMCQLGCSGINQRWTVTRATPRALAISLSDQPRSRRSWKVRDHFVLRHPMASLKEAASVSKWYAATTELRPDNQPWLNVKVGVPTIIPS